jgi:hypothetical protein
VRATRRRIWRKEVKLKGYIANGFTVVFAIAAFSSQAYEINNHADMSQTAAELWSLNQLGPNGKLARLGLKGFGIGDGRQTFPLGTDPAGGAYLGPIPYCFGSVSPREAHPDRQWRVTIPVGDTYFPTQQAGNGVNQPTWIAAGETKLTIAELIRYGACYEDEEHPYAKSVSHFYNPQSGGEGASIPILGALGPNSMEWMLKRNAGPAALTGPNHFSYLDARDYFYRALTYDPSGYTAEQRNLFRQRAWGQTFQALGHIVHHLQDMASPQHVRSDPHCNSVPDCRDNWKGALGAYRPSGYESYWEQFPQLTLIRGLAQLATTPILFGLPREFWNINTTDTLSTIAMTQSATPEQGIAAYTSTNFTSVEKDFWISA